MTRIIVAGDNIQVRAGRVMNSLPGWDSLDLTATIHSYLEVSCIVILALLVPAEVFAYIYGKRKDALSKKAHGVLEISGIVIIALLVFGEFFTYKYSKRRDVLSEQSAQAAIKAAPYKQSAVSVIARAIIKLGATGPNYERKPTDQSPNAAWLTVGKSEGLRAGSGPGGVWLIAEKYEKWGGLDGTDYILDFRLGPDSQPKNESVEDVLAKYDLAQMQVFFLPRNVEVLGGSIVVTVNSITQKTFTIPRQRVDLITILAKAPNPEPGH